MKPVRIICPTGHLGTTPLEKGSFELGCAAKPDYIIADSGSADIGPYPLGADKSSSDEVSSEPRSSKTEILDRPSVYSARMTPPPAWIWLRKASWKCSFRRSGQAHPLSLSAGATSIESGVVGGAVTSCER